MVRSPLAGSPANLPAVTLPVADPLLTSTRSLRVEDCPVFHRMVAVALAVPDVQDRFPPPFPRREPPVTPPPEHESRVPLALMAWSRALNVSPGSNVRVADRLQVVD